MRITDAKVIVCSPGRNFVTLKITTEDGMSQNMLRWAMKRFARRAEFQDCKLRMA